ncbi:unnamed protein product [Calypogeia fissa]
MTGPGRNGRGFPTSFTGSAIWLAGRLGLRRGEGGSDEGHGNFSGLRTRSGRRRIRRRGELGEEDDGGYECFVTDDDDEEDTDEDEEGRRNEDDNVGPSEGAGNCRLDECSIGQLIKHRSSACEDSTKFGRVKPGKDVNAYAMLAGREINVSGNGKFSRAERCHVSSKYLPTDGPTIVEQLHSRAYTGQFSADGSLFVAGFQDQRIRIYNVDKNWALQKDVLARNLRWTVTETALSPDQRFLVYASITPLVHLVNVGSESGGIESLANITDIHEGLDFAAGSREENTFGIWSLKFSHDGREIVAGTSDKSIYVYDLEANKPTFRVVAHKDEVNAVAFADSSSHLIYSGSDDNNCKVWDRRCFAQKSRAVGVLEGHLEGITFIDSFGDGQYFISNSKDQTIKLWDIRKMSSGPPTRVRPAKIPAFRWDYRWDDYPGRDKGLKHPYDQSVMTYKGHIVLRTLIRCYFSPMFSTGQKYIYTGSHDGHVYIYDVLTGYRVARLSFHRGTVRDVSWHPTQPMLVSSSWDGYIAKWEHLHGERPSSAQVDTRSARLPMDDYFDSD